MTHNKTNCIVCKNEEMGKYEHQHRKELIKPVSLCYGLHNETQDGKYVFFLDYDNKLFIEVTREIDSLVKKFPDSFTNFLILESSPSVLKEGGAFGSYHVISFSKFDREDLGKVLSETSADKKFIDLFKSEKYKASTLRVSPKFAQLDGELIKEAPRFVCVYPIKKLNCRKEISTAHLKTYSYLGLLPLHFSNYYSWEKQEDGLSWVKIVKYDSASK